MDTLQSRKAELSMKISHNNFMKRSFKGDEEHIQRLVEKIKALDKEKDFDEFNTLMDCLIQYDYNIGLNKTRILEQEREIEVLTEELEFDIQEELKYISLKYDI